jgi:hypothetical protein
MNDVETKIEELSKKIAKIKSIVICTTLISTSAQTASDVMPEVRSICTVHQKAAEA